MAVAGWLAVAGAAQATEVIARVGGVVGSAGTVRVSVCDATEYRLRVCRLNALAPARPGVVEVRVANVPPGEYAVIAHHDRVGDGVVHTDWLGIPTDGVGVSRNAVGWLGPPGWSAAMLSVGGATLLLEITLRQEPGK